jgi:hypothetical protein
VCSKADMDRAMEAETICSRSWCYEHLWFSVRLIGMAVEVAAAQTRYEMKICRNLIHLISRI